MPLPLDLHHSKKISDSALCFTESFLLGGQVDVISLVKEEGSSFAELSQKRFLALQNIASKYFPGEKSHEYFMALALLLAHSHIRAASPNPAVGCVYVQKGRVVGWGYTQEFGGRHAERYAQERARKRGESLQGATAYLTLEPCVLPGKQPPCCELLIQSGVREVYIAIKDPDEKVQGQGIEMLRGHGVKVHVGLLMVCATRLLCRYLLHRTRGGVPCIGGKWAQSLDGRFAAADGSSQWISSSTSLVYSQWLRYVYDGVMVGAGTFIHDRPALSLRHPFMVDELKQPLKIIFDPHSRALRDPCFKDHYQHLKKNTPRLLWITAQDGGAVSRSSYLSQEDGDEVLEVLDLDDIYASLMRFFRSELWCEHFAGMSLLVEGGPRLYNLLLGCGLMDFLHMVIAPKWLGGKHGIDLPDHAPRFPHPLSEPSGYKLISDHRFSQDILLEYSF